MKNKEREIDLLKRAKDGEVVVFFRVTLDEVVVELCNMLKFVSSR